MTDSGAGAAAGWPRGTGAGTEALSPAQTSSEERRKDRRLHAKGPRLRAGPLLAAELTWALLALAAWALGSRTPATHAVAVTVAFGLFVLWAVPAECCRYGTFGLVSPLALYAVFWLAYYGLAGLGSFGLSTNAGVGVGSQDLLVGLWVMVLALILMAAGYLAVTRLLRQPRQAMLERRAHDINTWVLAGCLAVGWAATLYLFTAGRYGYLSYGSSPTTGAVNGLVVLGAGLVPLSLAALGVVVWSDRTFPSISRRTAKVLIAANLPLLIVSALGSGVKGQLITDLVPLAAVYLMLRGRVPWTGIVLVVAYLILSFGGIQQLRQDIATGSLSSSQKVGFVNAGANAVSDVFRAWTSQSPTAHVREFWDSVSSEYATLPQVEAAILTQTPHPKPYVTATRFLEGPAFFLPSSWFQPTGFDLSSYVNVVYRHSTPTSSTTPTQPGDFFMSGGWPALVTGELAVGVFLGFIWRLLMLRSPTDRKLILYVVIATVLANAGSDWVDLVRTILQDLVVYGLITRVLLVSPASASASGPEAAQTSGRPSPTRWRRPPLAAPR